jgi:hypothetical protein
MACRIVRLVFSHRGDALAIPAQLINHVSGVLACLGRDDLAQSRRHHLTAIPVDDLLRSST